MSGERRGLRRLFGGMGSRRLGRGGRLLAGVVVLVVAVVPVGDPRPVRALAPAGGAVAATGGGGGGRIPKPEHC